MTTIERCAWPGDDPLYVAYHDEEWGVPVRDDRQLLAKLLLDGAQAGLSWITILRERDGYYRAFDGFEPEAIAAYDAAKVEALLQDPGIVRNRQKVRAFVRNARAYLALSRALKERGFSFVGPTICYAFMQAVGMVNDHVVSCFRHEELRR